MQDRQGTILDSNPAAQAMLGPLLEVPETLAEAGWLREDGSVLPADEHPVRKVLRTGTPVRNVVLGIAPSSMCAREPRCQKLGSRAPGANRYGCRFRR